MAWDYDLRDFEKWKCFESCYLLVSFSSQTSAFPPLPWHATFLIPESWEQIQLSSKFQVSGTCPVAKIDSLHAALLGKEKSHFITHIYKYINWSCTISGFKAAKSQVLKLQKVVLLQVEKTFSNPKNSKDSKSLNRIPKDSKGFEMIPNA